MTVLIAGGGIAGLALGLSLHQIGMPFRIFEKVGRIAPLGVGINLQPAGVRELMALGLGDALDQIGIATQDCGFYTRTGQEIWSEPRGIAAGYLWPQYSVHRGMLQVLLYNILMDRAGPECLVLGSGVARYQTTAEGVTATLECGADVHGALMVGADGIHSSVRAQMYPTEGAPVWGGAIMWRGTSMAPPFLSGASMILAGHDSQRIVAYPIGKRDPETGLCMTNWIAERSVDPATDVSREDWNREVGIDRFVAEFKAWKFDWLDVPALIKGAERVYEYPMVDRAPVESWTDGAVTLIGDAAHATYPVGSSGATQAILDARILAAQLRKAGQGRAALLAYEQQVRPLANAVTLANRGSGPDAIMQLAEDRCGGDFGLLDTLLPMSERQAHAERYKALSGMSVEATNARPAIL